MITQLTKIDDRMIKKGLLDDTEYRTDYRMKDLQKYNIPHWVDLGLKFLKPLYYVGRDEVKEWGSLFYMGTMYTENDGTNDGLQWDTKYWMNEILSEGRRTGKRHCTPFLLFKQLEDKSFELIDVNKVAVEVGANGRSYLYINDLNNGEFYDENTILKALLLPTETDYICSNMESTENREEDREEFNNKYIVPAANITISEKGELSFDAENWYEKIKLIALDMNIYKGELTSTDRAINVDTGIEYGKKIYLDSLILVNPEGHVDLSYLEDGVIKEMENNILYFDTDRFAGYKYYIFFFTESNKSINMIYNIPENILAHDTFEFVMDSDDYILLDKETFMDIMSEKGKYDLSLKIKDLKDNYKQLFMMENDSESYKEMEKYYLHDEEGNIVYDKEDKFPILDKSKFDMTQFDIKDGMLPVEGYPQSWYIAFSHFINYWFYRVLNYKKNLLMSFVNDDYKMFDNDIKYTAITYTLPDIPGEETLDGLETTRNRWTIYDEDQDYNGWTDQLVFINGKVDLDASKCKGNKSYIDRDYIEETYGEDTIIEVVYINYNANRELDVIIPNNPNFHTFKADRYYDPRSLNFFTVLNNAKMTDVDTTPIYGIEDMNNETLTQPIPFKMHLTDEHNTYSIQFNENWAQLYKDAEGDNKVCILYSKELIYAIVVNNGKITVYDITKANDILHKEYLSETKLNDYLDETDIKLESCDLIKTDLKDVKDCISFIYNKLAVGYRAIAFTYGDSINDSIHIDTVNDDKFDLKNVAFGNIIKIAKNMGGDRFGFINTDDKLFDVTYSDSKNEFYVQEEINLDIKELYPIESHNENSIITDCDTEIYYANGKIYTLSCPLGVIVKGYDLYDALGNLLYDKDGNIMRDGSVTVDKDRIRSYIKIYDVTTDEDEYEISDPEIITLNKVFIGAKIIATDKNLYIIGGNTGHWEIDRSCYKYNFASGELTDLNYPEWIGYSNMGYTLNDDMTKLIVLGGIGNWPEDTGNKIAILDLVTDTWLDPIESNINFINTTVINHNDEIITMGGYKNENDGTIDFKNVTDTIYKINLETGEATEIGKSIVPFISAKATHTVDGMYLISGNKYPEHSGYMYKYNPNTGNFSRFIEMPLDYDYISLCEFNYSDNITSILLTGELDNGYTTAKVLNIRHQNIDCFFADKYSKYNVIIDGIVYRYEPSAKLWIPMNNLKELTQDNPITRIELSGDIYIARAGSNRIYTSPNLIKWYDYKFTDFYDEEITEDNEICNIDFITDKLNDLESDEFDHNSGLSSFVTKDGRLLLNPYCMNTSMYYDNYLLIASNNRFVTETFYIDAETDYIILPDQFKYCLDDTHYAIFEDGRLLTTDCYKIVKPSIYSPVNGINIYLNYKREEDYEATLSVVYLPFPMINTESKTIFRASSGVLEVDSDNIKPFGVNNKWNWIFSNGEKVPFRYMVNVSNNLVYMNEFDNISWVEHPMVYRTYGDDLASKDIVTDDLDKLINTLLKDVVKDTHWGNDIQMDLDEFIEKSTFEERIVLLKVYSDHYVANADREGNTAPYILDKYEGQFYDVLDGNIEWRD